MPDPLFVVCFKMCVDVAVLRPHPDTGEPDLARAPLRISDFDERAIEEAVRLREKHGGRVVGVSAVTSDPPRELLLKALAMGLDAVRLVTIAPSDHPGSAAAALAEAIHALGEPALILCGEGSVDGYNGQTGPRLAELLVMPCVTYAGRIEIGCGQLEADRMLEDRAEAVTCALPAVVTVGGEINTPRLPSVLQLMAAGRKPVETVCGVATATGVVTLDVTAPSTSRKRIRIDGAQPAEAAISLLHYLARDGEVAV